MVPTDTFTYLMEIYKSESQQTRGDKRKREKRREQVHDLYSLHKKKSGGLTMDKTPH